MTYVPEGIDPLEWEKWDPKSKDKLLRALEDAGRTKRAWYCKDPGRACDGMEHEGYPYRHARGDQWPPPPGDWLVWLLKGGRGSGKTRSGSEWIRNVSAKLERTSIIGPTSFHVRGTMIEGDSGLLAVFRNAGVNALWEPSKSRITVECRCNPGAAVRKHPDGHFIQAFTGEEPERLRGPQHAAVWLDEPAHFDKIEAVWSNMLFGLRLGKDPKILCSTTPLPTKWMKELVKQPDTISVTVSTFANLANLAPTVQKTLKQFEGTRLGRQELYGEILEDIEGALWKTSMIDPYRIGPDVDIMELAKTMERIIVAIDPAGTSNKKRDETGIIVVGKKGEHFYVLADLSGHYSPDGWAKAAWDAFDRFEADLVVAEKNYGGEMVLSTLRNTRKNGPVKLVHSRRGKVLRAEPVVALYEQERVHHARDLTTAETQMTEWVPDMDDSPDRVDALVHGLTELSGGAGPASVALPQGELLGRGGASAPATKSLFGYQPREEDPIAVSAREKDAAYAAWMDRVQQAALLAMLRDQRDMPHCEHPQVFESPEGGINVCSTCLHAVKGNGKEHGGSGQENVA